MLLFADAEWEDTLDAALSGMCDNQGEVCCSTSRLLIEERIADRFVEELVDGWGVFGSAIPWTRVWTSAL